MNLAGQETKLVSNWKLWESEKSQKVARDRIKYVLKGCKCKTGCTSNRCKCKRSAHKCGPGCQCTNCRNTHNDTEGWDEGIQQLEMEDQEDLEENKYIEESDDEEVAARCNV